MSNKSCENPYARLGIGKRIAKSILGLLHSILPQRAYDAIYFPAYRTYHRWQRRRYGRRIRRLRRAGAHEKVVRAERVYRVMPYSLIGPSGLEHTHDLAVDVLARRVPGALVECGVARGGCAALLATVAATDSAERTCWFFDSYEGLPEPTDDDFADGKTGDHIRPLPKGSCLGAYEQVSRLLFEQFGFPRGAIRLVKGWFQDTLPVEADNVGPIALLRVDGDWYDSTRCCLENLYDSVSPGGFVIIDDYFSCYGARRATDEFLDKRRMTPELTSDGRGGCSFRKPLADEDGSRSDLQEAA